MCGSGAAGGDLVEMPAVAPEPEQLLALLPAGWLAAVRAAGFYGCSLCSASRLFYGRCVPAATPRTGQASESLRGSPRHVVGIRAARERKRLGREVRTWSSQGLGGPPPRKVLAPRCRFPWELSLLLREGVTALTEGHLKGPEEGNFPKLVNALPADGFSKRLILLYF